MKRIIKNDEPKQFSDWKAQDKMAHRPSWNRVPQPVRQVVRQSLLNEQGAICCYCEGRVTMDDSHVEHFRPKGPDNELDYSNLLCSCGQDGVTGEPRHCGHAKGSWFDETLLVSPLAPDCEDRFRFTGDGRILANDGDAAADMTINRLKLDLPKLRKLRSAAVDALSKLPPTKVRKLLATPDPNGSFLEFSTTIRQLLT